MAMTSRCSCSSSAVLARLELHSPWMRRPGNQPSNRKLGEFYSGSSIILRTGVSVKFRWDRDSATVKALVAGDEEEVEKSERPKTTSLKTRPQTVSSKIQRPARLGSEKHTSTPKEKVRGLNIISSLVDDIAGFMAPREKGDIRDVVLMSFSFAVFIYISQHLVHAYCVFRHTLQPFHHF